MSAHQLLAVIVLRTLKMAKWTLLTLELALRQPMSVSLGSVWLGRKQDSASHQESGQEVLQSVKVSGSSFSYR